MSNEQTTLVTIIVGAISAVVGGLFQHVRTSRKEKGEFEVVSFQTLLKAMQEEIERLKSELEAERLRNKEQEELIDKLEARIIALENAK